MSLERPRARVDACRRRRSSTVAVPIRSHPASQWAGLNTINPATGAATDVVPLDTGSQQAIFSITTVPGDATFYAISGATLYAVDRISGAATTIAPQDVDSPRGIEVIALPALPPAP